MRELEANATKDVERSLSRDLVQEEEQLMEEKKKKKDDKKKKEAAQKKATEQKIKGTFKAIFILFYFIFIHL
uniref:Trinucleotide repeat containing adaptor 6A n=1 Tax=Myotis myotis TaxID=51298 RepID=A0A7J7Y2N8_MYOMY|nr:trinucleotide repeat containing adaptor 6A [Myotis myotis]